MAKLKKPTFADALKSLPPLHVVGGFRVGDIVYCSGEGSMKFKITSFDTRKSAVLTPLVGGGAEPKSVQQLTRAR